MLNMDDMGLATGIHVSFRLFGWPCGTLALIQYIQNDRFGRVAGGIRASSGFTGGGRVNTVLAELLDPVIEAHKVSIHGAFWMIVGAAVLVSPSHA